MKAAKMDVASNDDSLTEIGKYFAILIFTDSYRPRNTAKIGRPRKFPRIRYFPVILKHVNTCITFSTYERFVCANLFYAYFMAYRPALR